jgi:hypothetical protein
MDTHEFFTGLLHTFNVQGSSNEEVAVGSEIDVEAGVEIGGHVNAAQDLWVEIRNDRYKYM